MPIETIATSGSKRAAPWMAILAIILPLLILNIIIPPVQSPDENSHLARAYLLSKGHILLDSDPSGSGGKIDDGLLDYTDFLHRLGDHGNLTAGLLDGVIPSVQWTGNESRRSYAGTGYYLPIIYLPQAAALAIGRLLDMSVHSTYHLTRIAVLLVTLGLVGLAAFIYRPGYIVLALLAMPMVVFQSLSTTIDGISFALCMLGLSCFMALLHQAGDGRGGWIFALLCMSVFIVAGSRAHALPMVLLPLWVAWQQRNRRYWILSIVTLLAVVGWTLFALLTVKDPRVARSLSTAAILRHYVGHPRQFFHILADTVGDKWLFYRNTFIGQLGYLNAYLPSRYHQFAAAVLGLLTLLSVTVSRNPTSMLAGRALLLVAAMGSGLLVFVAMIATWTPYPSQFIDGVQGRYFHIPALMAAYAFAGDTASDRRMLGRTCRVVLGVFVVVSALVMTRALLDRYWLEKQVLPAAASASDVQSVPISLNAGDVLAGHVSAPSDGKLYGMGFNLGTYFGRSNGTLSLRVCAPECRAASISVSRAEDNQFAWLTWGEPLQVSAGQPIRFELALGRDARIGTVLWAGPGSQPGITVELNGTPVDKIPQFELAIGRR